MLIARLARPIAFAAAFSATPVVAQDCDQDAAEERLNMAVATQIVTGFREFDGMPSIVLRPEMFSELDERTRLGMVASLECYIAGPGAQLVGVRFVSEGGAVLATFDGALRRWADD